MKSAECSTRAWEETKFHWFSSCSRLAQICVELVVAKEGQTQLCLVATTLPNSNNLLQQEVVKIMMKIAAAWF